MRTRSDQAHAGVGRRKLGALAALVGTLIVLSTASASASGGWPTSFRAPFADSSVHTWVSTEGNVSERNFWTPRWTSGGENNYEPTDLTFTKVSSYSSWTDIYWYVTNISAAGDTTCMNWSTSQMCEQFRVRIDTDADNLPILQERNLVCHEIGHTVGFGHGTDHTSCMSGGNNNILGWWEVNLINGRY